MKADLKEIEYLSGTFWEYVGVTLHFINSAWKLEEMFIACTLLPGSSFGFYLSRGTRCTQFG
jgi:hypothetical protein